jgi:hypothetical protein
MQGDAATAAGTAVLQHLYMHLISSMNLHLSTPDLETPGTLLLHTTK